VTYTTKLAKLDNNISKWHINALVDGVLLVEMQEVLRAKVEDVVILAQQSEMDISLMAQWNINVTTKADLVGLP